MKTYSRVSAALLVLFASLLAATVYAQERSAQRPTTTVKQQPSVAVETQARVKTTPTPTPTPGAKSKRPIGKLSAAVEMQTRQPQPPRMPNLVGVEVSKARSVITQTQPNAKLSVAEGRYTNNYQPGIVINQSPEPGTPLRPGAEVNLYYNPQPPSNDQIMPNLRGQNVDLAERLLRQPFPKLGIQRVPVNDTSVQPNTVARQIPAARQTYNAKTQVILYFRPADPPQPETRFVIVPDVMQQSVLSARRRISQANLIAKLPLLRINIDNYVITGQVPEAGARVPAGSEVILTVKASVTVPDLTRKTLDDARQILSQSGLSLGSVTRNPAANSTNEVLSQNPLPGSVVLEGTAVNLVIAVQRRVRVPDVRNQLRNNAEQLIASAGLALGQVETQESAVAAGTVIGQNPSPGAMVVAGSQVNLVIAIPLPTISTPTPTPTTPPTPTPTPTPIAVTFLVPDVRNKELTEAISLLRAAQLEVGNVTKKDSKDVASVVLEQEPPPGQRVAAGMRVNLVIGKQAETGGILKELPKVFGVMGLGFMAFLLGRLWKWVRSKNGGSQEGDPTLKAPPDPAPPPTAPALSFRTTMDSSSSEFAASTDLHVGFAVQFLPKPDWGQQYITFTGGLIAAESEEL